MVNLKYFYRPKKKLKGYSNKAFFLVLSVIIFLSILYVWQRVTVLRFLKEIEGLKKTLALEEERYKYLSLKTAELSSINRIEKIAQEKLGLGYSSQDQIVYLDQEKLNRATFPEDLWVRLKQLRDKLNPFEEKGVQAKEIKHDL